MERIQCVICSGKQFTPAINLLNTINIVSINKFNSSEIKELFFIGCLNCGCIQLRNLFLQNEIYSQPLQIFDGPAIQKHHELFCDFIIKNINYEEVLFEIGGSYGNLAKRIITHYKNRNIDITYKILEYSAEHYPKIENIEYISGDCEVYSYNNIKTIIMSHVFEHLYNPRDFLKKISNTDIHNIFISIPDMDSLSKIGDINNLNCLHTFYINSKYIIYLFQLAGFHLKDIYEYKNNSIFYYFVKNDQYKQIENIEYKQTNLLTEIPNFYKKMTNVVEQININQPFYICPSGFYGQFIYFYLNKETKKNAIGFLDGDKYKIDKRLSGTELTIYEKKHIMNCENIIVLISSVKHQTEIINELLNYNNKIKYINAFQ